MRKGQNKNEQSKKVSFFKIFVLMNISLFLVLSALSWTQGWCYTFFLQCNRWKEGVYNLFWLKILSEFGDQWLILMSLLVLGCISYIFGYRKLKKQVIWTAGFVLMMGICVKVLKFIVARPRPEFFLSDKMTECVFFSFSYDSFPSGHTVGLFSFILPLSLLYPVLGYFLLPIAYLSVFFRVFLGDHYISDITFSIAITFVLFYYYQNCLKPPLQS